jgi:hypothetical protein
MKKSSATRIADRETLDTRSIAFARRSVSLGE